MLVRNSTPRQHSFVRPLKQQSKLHTEATLGHLVVRIAAPLNDPWQRSAALRNVMKYDIELRKNVEGDCTGKHHELCCVGFDVRWHNSFTM